MPKVRPCFKLLSSIVSSNKMTIMLPWSHENIRPGREPVSWQISSVSDFSIKNHRQRPTQFFVEKPESVGLKERNIGYKLQARRREIRISV